MTSLQKTGESISWRPLDRTAGGVAGWPRCTARRGTRSLEPPGGRRCRCVGSLGAPAGAPGRDPQKAMTFDREQYARCCRVPVATAGGDAELIERLGCREAAAIDWLVSTHAPGLLRLA